MIDNRIEIVFSVDTTGSMYPCLTQVRRKIAETVKRLTKDIPGIRIGLICHGDYCDAGSSYVTKALDLTDDGAFVVRFVENVGPTGGGDAPECYELVLHEARSFSWTAGYKHALVLIGDDVPHGPKQNPKKLDWRAELDALIDVDHGAVIKDFVLANGLTFRAGRGFYEFTKTETIQAGKEIVLMERSTGDMFGGDHAREMLGLPIGTSARIKPSSLDKYAVFVQSTSYNRKLTGGTRFLYEVEDWDRVAEAA